MKITEKGFYRLRCGDIAFVGFINEDKDEPFPIEGFKLDDNNESDLWTRDGFSYINGTKTGVDIVKLIKPYSEEMLR